MESLVIFDIKGPFAHFRAFYTNSSSLSYGCPPRTVLTGIIAGILGLEKDSYYEIFSCKNCKIAVSLRTPFRKLMQTVNYVRTKELKELNLSGGHTQIPLEILLPPPRQDNLIYRVYFHHPNFDKLLRDLLQQQKAIFPPYLGLSEFLAKAELVDFIEASNIIAKVDGRSAVEIHSVIPVDKLGENGICLEDGKQYIKELMPVEFNPQRIARTANFIYERNGKSILLRLKGEYYQITYKEPPSHSEVKENIVFLE